MTAENDSGVQTRAMTEAQHIEEEAQRQLDNQHEQAQRENPIAVTGPTTPNLGPQDPAMNPTVELHKIGDENIKELIKRQGAISLDWYVPNLSNTG